MQIGGVHGQWVQHRSRVGHHFEVRVVMVCKQPCNQFLACLVLNVYVVCQPHVVAVVKIKVKVPRELASSLSSIGMGLLWSNPGASTIIYLRAHTTVLFCNPKS